MVSKFTTDIASNGELYTDSNGRDMMHRRRNFRPTWNLTQTEAIAGNVREEGRGEGRGEERGKRLVYDVPCVIYIQQS